MFDKDKIEFHGNNLTNSYGPICEEHGCLVGGGFCLKCPYCYGMKVRFWNKRDEDNAIWYNAEYNGYVLCSRHNNNFTSKIKNHIFKLLGSKKNIKNLSE